MLNGALRFALEIAGVASLAIWGWTAASSPMRLGLALGAPLALILIWARWIAPRANSPLAPDVRVVVGSGLLLIAAGALWIAGYPVAAAAFAALNVVNTVAIVRWPG